MPPADVYGRLPQWCVSQHMRGTVYALAFGSPRWFGAITPIGGVCMLIGWALLAYAALRAK